MEGPPLSNWKSSGALDLWVKEKAGRVNRREPRKTSSLPSTSPTASSSLSTDSCNQDVDDMFTLNDWEDLISDIN